MTSTDSTRLLRNRDFRLLWSGNALSAVGSYGARIAYPLAILTLTGSPALAGSAAFAAALPGLILQLPAGAVADVWDRRRTLLICQGAGLVAAIAAGAVLLFDIPGRNEFLMIAAFTEGCVAVFFGLTELAAIRDVVSEAQRPAAFSFYEAEQPVAILLGRAIGATLFGAARWLPFLGDALSYVFCLGTLSAVRADMSASVHRRDREDERRSWKDLCAGVRLVWASPFLRNSTLVIGVANMVFQTVILLVIVLARDHGLPAWTVGVMLAATGAGGIVGSVGAAPLLRRVSAPVTFAMSVGASAGLLIPFTITSNPYILAAAMCGNGTVMTVCAVAITMYRVEAVPDHLLGRVVGAAAVVTDGGVPLGALLGGYLLATSGTHITALVVWGVMLGLALLTLLLAHSANAFQLRADNASPERIDVPC